MKTPASTLIEYLSTQAKIMSKIRAPSADMMREAAERMQDMWELLKSRSSEEAVEAELLQLQVARMYEAAEYEDSQFRNDDPVGNWQKFREGWKYRILKTDNGPKVETVLEFPKKES